jgi:hypothetical protein
VSSRNADATMPPAPRTSITAATALRTEADDAGRGRAAERDDFGGGSPI